MVPGMGDGAGFLPTEVQVRTFRTAGPPTEIPTEVRCGVDDGQPGLLEVRGEFHITGLTPLVEDESLPVATLGDLLDGEPA
jgi:hypothetical protein